MADLMDLMEGRRLRDEGMASVDAHESEEWRAYVDSIVEVFAASGEPFTAEEVRLIAGDPPHHPNAMGARFAYHIKRKTIERVGVRNATRGSAHARALMVYKGRR